MIEYICEKLMKWCEKRGRVLKITGTAGPDDVYLIRYYVIKSRFLNVFIHQFLRSDRDDLHDHPWDFMTYLVRGAYTENKWNFETKKVEATRRANYFISGGNIKLNRLVFRRATDQHQVVVDRDLKESEKDQAALTLFISGPTKREWGFIKEAPATLISRDATVDGVKYNVYRTGPRTWVPWREYLGLPSDAKGRG